MSRYPHTMLATCCIPWDRDGGLAESAFRASIRRLLEHDLRHLYIFGTAGEGHSVSDRQFDEIVTVFIEEMQHPACFPMVGVISLSLSTVIERVERTAAQGITAFQISLPSWAALADDEVDRFFAETCGRFPHLQFLHYNLPRSRRLVTAKEYAALSNRHPNLVATKNAGANQATTEALMNRAPQLRHFFTEPGYGYASLFGGSGLLLSVSSMNPRLARAYFQAGVERDLTTLINLTRELAALTAALEGAVGLGRVDGVYDKCISKLLDPSFPLRLLAPYTGASDEEFANFLGAVQTRYPHWLPRSRNDLPAGETSGESRSEGEGDGVGKPSPPIQSGASQRPHRARPSCR